MTEGAHLEYYEMRSELLILRDGINEPERKIDFHVETGDCFAMIATAIGLTVDSLEECESRGEPPSSASLMLLKNLREDLLYLQRDYSILPKEKIYQQG